MEQRYYKIKDIVRIQYMTRSLFILLLMMVLSSCATFRRETRFVPETWQTKTEESSYFSRGYKYSVYRISELPRVEIYSHCVSDNSLFFGPYFIIPLPIIPNPFWPLQYLHNEKFPATFALIVESPPNTLDWDTVHISVLLNDVPLKEQDINDRSTIWIQSRSYGYDTGLTCGKLEGAKIKVQIEGPFNTINKTLLYIHRWRVYAEGS